MQSTRWAKWLELISYMENVLEIFLSTLDNFAIGIYILMFP